MMKKKLAVLTLALSAAMMLSFGAFAEDTHSGNDETLVEHAHEGCMADEPVEIIKQDATCTTDGYIITRYACKEVGDLHVEVHEETKVLPATGHKWASEQGYAEWGRMTVAPTCTTPGQAIDYCEYCGEERDRYRDIAVLDHKYDTYVEDIESTCDHAGRYYWACDFCGTPKTDKNGIIYYPIDRDYEYHYDHPELFDSWIVEKEPTCLEDGQRIRFCTKCGAKQVETIDALGHNYVESKRRVINCYNAELTWTCTRCNDKTEGHEYTETVPVVSHVFEYTEKYIDKDASLAPTCEKDGYTIYKCKYYDNGDITSKDGMTHDKDETATVKIVNLALGHDWTDWVQRYGVNEQGNKYGYWMRSCKRKGCGKTQELVAQNPPEEYGKNGWVNESGKISYYKQDVLQKDMTGVYAYNDGMFFVTEGTIDSGANGLNLNEGTWYFLANGQIQFGHDGFAEYDNNWFMIKDGMLDENANGLYDYDGGKFLFAAGKLRTDVSGLWQDPSDGSWYYLSKGQVATNHTGVVQYDGAFFYVVNGRLASSMNGTVEYDGATFKVVNGQLY